MDFERDPKTGLIVSRAHGPNEEMAALEDPELGESRRAYMKLVQEGNKLESMIALIDRSNNPVRGLDTSLDAQLLYQGHDLIKWR